MGDHKASQSVVEESIKISRENNDLPTLAEALGSLGHCALYAGDSDTALKAAQEGIRICEREGFLKELIWAYDAMVHIYNLLGNKVEARNYRKRGAETLKKLGAPIDSVDTEMDTALEAVSQGAFDEGVKHMDAAVEIMESHKDKYRLTFTKSEFAHSLRKQGAYEKALLYYRRTILMWQDWGHRGAIAHQLECFAYIAIARKQVARAARLFGAAESLREVINSIRTPAEQTEFEGAKSRLQVEMGAGEFNEAWEEGCSISMEQAIEYALERTDE
jgi:tetratricopeptide (TPR) repeat protein